MTRPKLISMSLWGSDPLYIGGFVENARLASVVYPGWRLRVYADSEALEALLERGFEPDAEGRWRQPRHPEAGEFEVVVRSADRSDSEGLFWRFEPADDASIERVIVRDADSRLNAREATAVQAWIDSGLTLHLMRDHQDHAGWPVMGGMWGIVGGTVRLRRLMEECPHPREKLSDQYFLAHALRDYWLPDGRRANDCLQHVRDGLPRPYGGEAFPPHPAYDGFVGEIVGVQA